jgi:predicted enzyme related to lactoylglutathione lyase
MPRVVHFEIHAGDPPRARDFYTALFGWTFTRWEGPMDYWLVTTGPDSAPGINGGMIQRQGAVDGTAVIAYVGIVDVPDLDATLRRAAELGGEVVVPKMPVPGMGWLGYLKDTEGNIVGAMQSDPTAG